MLGWNNRTGGSAEYTSDRSANRLLRADDNAFLFGVIFDQGIAYERAWRAPYLLKGRLGHLSMKRLAKLPIAEVRTAVRGSHKGGSPPSLPC